MSSIMDTPVKKHKKHKKDKSREERDGTPTLPGTPGSNRLKLILKVGGSSTPEHSDSPGPSSLSVLNVYDEDSQQSNLSFSTSVHSKKSKKKEKKSKKEKKHKHRHKEKRKRERDESMGLGLGDVSMAISMDIDSMESGTSSSAIATGIRDRDIKSITLGEIGLGSPSSASQSQFELDVFTGVTVGASGPEEIIPEIVEQKPIIPYKQKPAEKQPFQKLLDSLLRGLQKKDPDLFFAWPVTDKIAPGYSQIIKDPMDFSTMKTKIDISSYNTLPEFIEDFKLMCNNAMIYNGPETIYYKAAKKLLQSGIRNLVPERIRSLLPLMPAIRVLSEEALGFCLIPEVLSHQDKLDSQSEEDHHESICLDPTKSVHYVPPHPNDPPDLSGAFTDDLTTEEILHQARIAAREAAHRLATKKPNSKMGFLRQQPDGSTSLAILTPTNGVLPGTQEQPVTLNVVAGKLAQGTTQLHGYKDERKNIQRTVKPLNYGAFSSFAPCLDSTFSNLTSEESDMIKATYGEETAVQYAESMIEFAKGCDYAMIMVDELLDTITKGEHKKAVNVVEERKKLEEEEANLKREQSEFAAQLEMEWENATKSTDIPPAGPAQNLDSLHSLNELGIDTSFIEEFKEQENPVISERLKETAELIGDLQKVQNDRLRLPTHPLPPHVTLPSDEELRLAERITENLTNLTKNVPPGSVASEEAIRKAMGVDLENATFNFGIPEEVKPIVLPVEQLVELPCEAPEQMETSCLEETGQVDPLAQEVETATNSISQELEAATNSISQELEAATNSISQDLGAATNSISQEIEAATNSIAQEMEAVADSIAQEVLTIQVPTGVLEIPMAESAPMTTIAIPMGIASEEPIISSTTNTPPEEMQIDHATATEEQPQHQQMFIKFEGDNMQ